jgi:polyisoprenoid-binding protein YceI
MKKLFWIIFFISQIALGAEIQKPALQNEKIVELDKFNSEVTFSATGKPSLIKINGEKGKLSGNLIFRGSEVSGKLKVLLENISTGISLRDDHMKNKYLNVKDYPEATLTIQKIILPSDPFLSSLKLVQVPFDGILTIKGVESPVKGTFDLNSEAGKQIDIVAKVSTMLTNHKVDIPSYMGIKVADDVQIQSHFVIKN